MTGWFETAVNLSFMLFLPLWFVGLANKTKAFWAGRKGPPLLQAFFNFIKLMKKGQVISTSSSFVFRIFPSVVLAAVILAAVLVPMAGHHSILAFEGDFLVFAMALGLAGFFGLIGAMDVGSPFEGMGASREASFTCLVEMAFLVIVAALAGIAGRFSLQSVFSFPDQPVQLVILTGVLAAMALFLMLLVEGSRVPIDDPDTHLELTMLHEVMILDNSGPDLAYLHYASGLKMVVFGSLIVNLALPSALGFWESAVLFVAGQSILSMIVGTIESLIARVRLNRLPEFIFIMVSAAVIIFFCLLLFTYRGLR